MSCKRENIPVLLLRGDTDFCLCFGHHSRDNIRKYREMGMPHFYDGSHYCYSPEKVIAWMEETFKDVKIGDRKKGVRGR